MEFVSLTLKNLPEYLQSDRWQVIQRSQIRKANLPKTQLSNMKRANVVPVHLKGVSFPAFDADAPQ
jgi:hypothetical protein